MAMGSLIMLNKLIETNVFSAFRTFFGSDRTYVKNDAKET